MKEVQFRNEALKEAVDIAKQNGFHVYAFQETIIGQVFITNGIDICSLHSRFGTSAIDILHVYKPCENYGTATPSNHKLIYYPTIEAIKKGMNKIWFENVRHYKSWEEYVNFGVNKILNYFEI